LWEERQLVSVANLTRQDAAAFLPVADQAQVLTSTTRYPLHAANQAVSDLRAGRIQGAAVLVPA
jgi:propanol-preferring alcohol dehydrogenase